MKGWGGGLHGSKCKGWRGGESKVVVVVGGGRRRRKGRNMPLINSSATVLFSHDWVAIKKVCHNLSKLMTQWHTSSQGLEDTLTYVELVNSFIIAEIRIPALAK